MDENKTTPLTNPYSFNFGTDLYEYLERWYPEYAECHVRWHSCICLLMKYRKLDPIPAHAVHVWLRDLGIQTRIGITRSDNVTWEDANEFIIHTWEDEHEEK